MTPTRSPAGWQDAGPADLLGAGALAVLAAAAAMTWAVTFVAAAFAGHRLAMDLSGALHGAAGWHRHLANPRQAFPGPARGQLPGPTRMYTAVATVTAASVALLIALSRLWPRMSPAGSAPGRSGQGYATGRDIRAALSADAARSRGLTRPRRGPSIRRLIRPEPGHDGGTVFLGVDIRSRQQLHGAAEDSYLYLGPPRSGKGVHLIIPQTLDAPGPALVTATRPDTLRHTARLRETHGPVLVFDPQQLAGPSVDRLRWAPEHGCADPLTAITRAKALAAGAQLSPATVTDAAFWTGMTEAVLRGYLHAADLGGRSMRDVLTWAARPADPTPLRILRSHPKAAPGWAEELAAQAAADPRQRDSVWAGVRRAVDSLADPRVLDACSPPREQAFDPTAFLTDGGTLYLLGTTGAQLTISPLITALVECLVDAARSLAAAQPGGRLTPPLTLLLDEAANIAPIPSLPNLLSDGGGSGITTICVLQSLAQARARWGPAGADAMWDAATTKVILGGLAHADDLLRISKLAGDVDEPTRTRTAGAGGTSTSTAARRLPALPIEKVRTLPAGHAIVLARRTPPIHARLQPWWHGPHAGAINQGLQLAASATAERRGESS